MQRPREFAPSLGTVGTRMPRRLAAASVFVLTLLIAAKALAVSMPSTRCCWRSS